MMVYVILGTILYMVVFRKEKFDWKSYLAMVTLWPVFLGAAIIKIAKRHF